MTAVIYARYSSSSQREASIEEQVRICKQFADRNGYMVAHVYKDSAITGKTDKRPEFQLLLKECTKKPFDAVIVYSIDRFGRNLLQSLGNASKIEDCGICLLSATEVFTNTPSGKLHRNMMMCYAQYYSDDLAQKIKCGMDFNGEHCLSTGGNIALGFKVNEHKQFEIDPEKAPLVRMIFEMYADGRKVTEIVERMNSMGYRTAHGSQFNKNSLHTILKNKRYIGTYTYKGTEIPNSMPRIISDEVFNKVADRMSANKKAPARARAKVEYLLTTKLFCGRCKEMMTGFSATGKQGKVYNYYICNGRKAKKCEKGMVKKDYIEDMVVSQCRKFLTPANIAKIAQKVSALCEEERDTSNLRFLKKDLADNKKKQENALNAVMETDNPTIRKGLYDRIAQLETAQKAIETAIAQEVIPFPSLTEPKISFFLTALRDGSVKDIKYRKMLIRLFVNRIYLYDDHLTTTFNTGEDTVEINDRLLAELEENSDKERILFKGKDGPPSRGYKKDIARENPDFIGVFTVLYGKILATDFVDVNRSFSLYVRF